MINYGEKSVPEFKTWSLENLGQVLKVSGSLPPEVFPYQVSVSKNSVFFKNAYDGVLKGEGVTVLGTKPGQRPSAGGILVEHHTVLAANDLGEVMISREVFEGDFWKSLTDYSLEKFIQYSALLDSMPLPPGWRRFGDLHSHPVVDVLNSILSPLTDVPKVDGIGVTWSYGDFNALVKPIGQGHTGDTVLGVITPVQLAFMVATSQTIEVLQRQRKEVQELIKKPDFDSPPYKNFAKLGIVMYAGNHHARLGKNFSLQRLT